MGLLPNTPKTKQHCSKAPSSRSNSGDLNLRAVQNHIESLDRVMQRRLETITDFDMLREELSKVVRPPEYIKREMKSAVGDTPLP